MKTIHWVLVWTCTLGLMLASENAGAFGVMKVGEWNVEFSGNINGFASHVECDAGAGPVLSGLACGSGGVDYDDDNVRTGLLPSWFGFHAGRTENDTEYGITIGFQPGIDSGADATGGPIDGGLGLNSANFRQVFLEFSGKRWGGIKIGRDIGLFGSEAILSDMTLFGVGTVSDLTRGGGNTSLGRIGVGYLYADWKGQVQYTSPQFGGFTLNVALVDPWGLVNLSGVSQSAASFVQEGSTYGVEAKLAYAWGKAGEDNVSGKLWASFIRQSLESTGGFASEDALGYDVGAKVTLSAFEVVAYYYTGEAIGSTGFLFDALDLAGNARDSDGFYAQLTYKIPGPGTRLGVSWGESNLDRGPADPVTTALFETNESLVAGIYHPLTSAVNLVAEYTRTEATAHNGNEAEETAIALGAILFY